MQRANESGQEGWEQRRQVSYAADTNSDADTARSDTSARKSDESETECKSLQSANMRIIEPVMEPYVVRTEKTIAAIFFGVNSRPERWLFHLGVRDKRCQVSLFLSWFIGVSIGSLVLADILPPICEIGCLLALPLPLVSWLLLSTDLVVKICHELELWIIYLLQAVLVTHAFLALTHVRGGHGGHGWHWDSKIFAILSVIPFMLVGGLLDAYPAKYRATFEILFFSGATYIFVVWNALIVFEHHSLDPVTSQIGDNVTLLLFYMRHIWSAIAKPELLGMIKSDVDSIHEEVSYTEDKGGAIKIQRTTSAKQQTVTTAARSRKSLICKPTAKIENLADAMQV